MIEVKQTGREDVLEIRISGTVTDADYKDVLIPALEKAIEESERVRLLVSVASDFKDYTLGAIVADTRTGLRHWRGFDRIAVATDSNVIGKGVKALGLVMSCPVRVFSLSEEEDARRWLVESLGSIHQEDLGDGVLHIRLLGQLDSAAYEGEAEDLSAFLRENEHFRLLLDLREFDGWQGLAALGEHLKVVRDHYKLIDKAALVGDKSWQKLAQRVARQIVRAETRYFPGAEFEAAKDWLKTG